LAAFILSLADVLVPVTCEKKYYIPVQNVGFNHCQPFFQALRTMKKRKCLIQQMPWQKGELEMKWPVYQEKLGMKKNNLKKLMEYDEKVGR